MMNVTDTASAVAEIQGLYGPFSFPEKLLQKIWLRGDFECASAATTDGRRVQVLHPGKWNLLGGPDFKAARLRLGDAEIVGDVELHLHAGDWVAHAHARDRAYDGVVLHVVLFPPEPAQVTRGADNQVIPVLVLLPLLHHDLEEFAAEAAVEALAGRTATARIPDELAAFGSAELGAALHTHAAERWRQKVYFARLRVQRLGWETACHQSALEILGYRLNRAPMLRVAARWPMGQWARGAVEIDEVIAAEAGAWSLQGVFPANHPRTRLRQCAIWTKAGPDWPAQLAALAGRLPEIGVHETTGQARRVRDFAAVRKQFAELSGCAVVGTRLDNLVCDGFLPLLAAHSDRERELAGVWFHWFPGDLPPLIVRELRRLGVFGGRASPACHGVAQGLLGWLLDRETRR
jgi:hypothetical protein